MRLSDILKKVQEQKNITSEQTKSVSPPNVSQYQQLSTQIIKNTQTEESISQKTDVEKVYSSSIFCIKKLFSELKSQKTKIDVSETLESVKNIAELINQNNQEILLYTSYSTPDIYIYGHSVNVSILSGVIGKAKGFSIEELKELILCGFLHDIGMVRVLNVAQKQTKLTEPEFEEIKKHSQYIKEEISKLDLPFELQQKLISVISQVHERVDGSGYPNGIEIDDIHLYARIISVADVYEAMTHPRPYRDRILPHNAIVALVDQAKGKLDSQLVKLFVDRISIFPVGSYVKLNTGEIARVIATNISFPVRPVVKIVLTEEKIAPKEPKVINLAENSQISIVEAVDETKIDTKDKKLLLQLKASRWWVKSDEL
jgi:HD-GYP domain-containing protein (c-di-GMP phosphodiesterase class II)